MSPTRRLILMRHARARRNVSPDHARPLRRTGLLQARDMAEQLDLCGWVPQRVQGSDSRRTQHTWEVLRERWGERPASFTGALYLAGLRELWTDAAGWDDGATVVLALGHNFGWSDAASELSGVEIMLSTGAAALLEGEGGTWAEALGGRWRLDRVLVPRIDG